ncbi:MAG: T9SS type A sorting domain-containing protein [Vicingaceae bacterium]|nr:T9SS type A sorting domain-containing protein [Vicingaceae bacterium]
MTTLDVTQNTNLEILWCAENQLTNLNITQNTALTELLCSSNQLTILDISQNLQLFNLRCNSNQISSLDVTMLANLGDLDCSDNNISSIDVTLNTGLLFLNCGRNLISTIDVSQNLMLISFRSFNSNNIQTIDLTNNTSLTFVDCAASFQLTELKVKNGNNVNVTYFRAEICPNLKCIYVDDKNASYLSSWIKDTSSHWVNDTLDCQNVTSLNEYDNKSNFLNIYPNPATNYAYFEFKNLPAELTIYNTQQKIVFKEQIETKTYKLALGGFEKGVYLCNVSGIPSLNKLVII